MRRNVLVTRSGLAAASFAAIAMTACNVEKDETGGRPVVESTPSTTQSTTQSPAPASTETVARTVSTRETVRGSGTPVNAEYGLGEKAFRERRYADAVVSFGEFTSARPENPWGHYMLGLSAWKAGDVEKARTELERTVELDPGHVKGRLNLARVLLDLGNPKDARKHVVAALAVDSTSGEGHRLMGRVQSTLHLNEEAIVSYRLALRYDPDDVWSMNNMALILIQQQRFTEALSPLARAVAVDSTVPVFHNNLGIALEHLGQYTLATASYRKAVGADSSYTKALMSLARVDGRKEETGIVPVNLAHLSDEFDKAVRSGTVAVARRE
jgi:predicted Zn-dependent protease